MEEMEDYMRDLDAEIQSTKLGKDFERVPSQKSLNVSQEQNISEDRAMYEPVDIDYNLVKNLLNSISSSGGLPGPATGLLAEFGIRVPTEGSRQFEEVEE